MQNVILDIQPFEEKISLHQYFKEQLDLPFYYGGNLDALFDELSSTTEPMNLTLRYSAHPKGALVEYLPKLLRVFQDAARENYNLTIQYEQVE